MEIRIEVEGNREEKGEKVSLESLELSETTRDVRIKNVIKEKHHLMPVTIIYFRDNIARVM
jgi:hypothetical protein